MYQHSDKTYLVKDRLQLSDSVSEMFVFGAKRLQLILQLFLLLLGETQSLKLLLQLQAMLGLLLKWSEEENTQGDGADFSGKRVRGMEFRTTSFNSNLAWLFHTASQRFPPAAAALPPPPTVGFCLAGCRSLLFWLSSSPACPWLFGGLRGRRGHNAKRQSKQAQNISWTDAPQHRVRFELRKYNVSLNCTDYCPSKSMPCDCSITHWI